MATFNDDQCVQCLGNESHLSRLSSGLNQLRQQASFCDVNIIVGDQRFPAHRAVLSSTSDYFQGMFSSGFQESTMSEVTVPGTEESFAQILDFAYTGYFTLSLRTVIDILKMACYMVFTEAMELCAEYLREVKDKFTIEDCFEIWGITSSHSSLLDTAQLYRSHLMRNFSRCVGSQVFLEKSSASFMMEFLSDEEIELDNMMEEQILQAALIWLKFDWEQRKVHAVGLLKKIRLGLVPVHRLKEILVDELLAIPECKDMVEEVVKLSAAKDTASLPLIRSHPELFASRNTIIAKLFNHKSVTDESSSEPIVSFKCKTDTACYKITKLANIPNQRSYSGRKDLSVALCVSNRNQLYIAINIEYFGQDIEDSENHEEWLSNNNFFQYLSEKNEWSVLSPMPKVVEFPRMLRIGEDIYMLGESDECCCIQRYSILSKSWEILEDDTWFNLSDVIVVSMRHILIKGYVFRDDDDDDDEFSVVVALYKPTTNELLDVSVDGTLDRDSFFVECDSKCFELMYEPEFLFNRLTCNFKSDKPTMVIAEATEDETCDVLDMQFSPEVAFDKRKLGFVQVPCECASHVKKE